MTAKSKSDDTPRFFPSAQDFRRWLEKNHASKTVQWVGYYRKSSGRPSMTWQESVDEALCFGWIDGLRKSIDPLSYKIRFTPRKTRSTWSVINLGRVAVLQKEGKMQPAGLAAYEKRSAERTGTYAYEQRMQSVLDPASEKAFRARKQAWKFFTAQAPSYQKVMTWWVVSAKQEATRLKRISKLMAASEEGRRL